MSLVLLNIDMFLFPENVRRFTASPLKASTRSRRLMSWRYTGGPVALLE